MKFKCYFMVSAIFLASLALLFPAATAACMGTISFSSEPSYAQIYIDGELMGTTSPQAKVEMKGILCGDHLVELKLDGYETYTKEIKVEGGTGYGVSGVMVPLTTEPAVVTTAEAEETATPPPQAPETQATPGMFAVTVIFGIALCAAAFCLRR